MCLEYNLKTANTGSSQFFQLFAVAHTETKRGQNLHLGNTLVGWSQKNLIQMQSYSLPKNQPVNLLRGLPAPIIFLYTTKYLAHTN